MAADAARDAEVEADAEPDASGPVACQPALSISPAEGAARPLDLLTFRPSGGSGSWRFELTEDRSGALLNETTGALVRMSVSYQITRPMRTEGEAVAVIRVVPTMHVAPRQAQVERGNSIEFEISDGSGDFDFELDTVSGAMPPPMASTRLELFC